MDIELFNNKVLIIKDGLKKYILDLLKDRLINVKIITLSELKKKYYFDYDKEAIYYICNKYNVVSEIAKMYLNNLYYVKDVDSEKIKFLNELKSDLLNQGLLRENKLFRSFLKRSNIVLYNLKYVDKFYENIFNELPNVERINYEHTTSIKKLYKANNLEEEIFFVASEICKLVKSGVSINNIKLANVSNDYYFIINKTFKLFNIPINLNSLSTCEGTIIVKRFKECFSSDLESTINEVNKLVKNNNDKKLVKQIINILNTYNFVSDKTLVKDLIFEDIDKITINKKIYKNAVEIIDIENTIVSDSDYVFLINYTEGSAPFNYKNEDYLNDKEKNLIGISDSVDLNIKAIDNIRDSISMINHLVVTYPEYMLKQKLYLSSSYKSDLFEECDISIDYNNSDKFNKIKLLIEKDINNKYGSVSDDLILLNNHYKNEPYLDYRNEYTVVDNKELRDHMKNQLTVSYSSINSYYECAFKYYLSNIISIDKYSDTFDTELGNIYHLILSKCLDDDNYDIDSVWDSEVKNSKYVFNNKELFFLDKLHEELKKIVEVIKNQKKYTSLTKSVYEKRFLVDVNKDLHITFKGFADKILYDEINGKQVIVIIDYKTGEKDIDLGKVVYGLGMQLPVYVYLAKNSPEFKDSRIGGFYLQILLNKYKDDKEFNNGLKLKGYTNSDENIISIVDSSYNDSNLIRNMKTTNNGFSSNAKLISDEEIEELSNIIKDRVEEASMNIVNGVFPINPKQIKDTIVGCQYCKYKDICYMKNEDIVPIVIDDNIFGGDKNA